MKCNNKDLSDYRMMATYTVRYKLDGKWHILQPGQVLPVWDVKYWSRYGPEVEVCILTVSVDSQGDPVRLPGYQKISQEKYLVAKRSPAPDKDEAKLLESAKLTPLGGNSRFSILRPSRLPIGFGLFREPVSSKDSKDQWEGRKVTFSQVIEPMQKLKHCSESFLPMPRLFTASKQGMCKGRDVMSEGAVVGLKEVLLPVCPLPLDEGFDTLDYAAAAEKHLERVGADLIYIGFGIYPNLDTTSGTPEKCVDLETYRAAYATDAIMYTLPHGPAHDYNLYLKAESQRRAEALLQGYDELEPDAIPVPEFVPGRVVEQTSAMPEWQRTSDTMQESGLP